jgi:hypothetical protein
MFLKLSSCLVGFIFVISMANDSKLNSILNITHQQSPTSTASPRRKTFYFNIFLKSDLFGSLLEFRNTSEIADEAENDDEKENLTTPIIDDENSKQKAQNQNDSANEDNSLLSSSTHLKVTSAELYNQNTKRTSSYSSLESNNTNRRKQQAVISSNLEEIKVEMNLLVNLIELIYSPKCKSNFYIGILSLMLIHFWILSTYLVGYLASPSTYTSYFGTEKYDIRMSPVSYLIEILAALVGGVGTALFFKNMILIVFENSHLVEAGSSFGGGENGGGGEVMTRPKRVSSLQHEQEKSNAQKSFPKAIPNMKFQKELQIKGCY